eukprot:5473054-Ditylum_brightwellii.AAC.1
MEKFPSLGEDGWWDRERDRRDSEVAKETFRFTWSKKGSSMLVHSSCIPWAEIQGSPSRASGASIFEE